MEFVDNVQPISLKDVLKKSLALTLSIATFYNKINVSDVLNNQLKLTNNIKFNFHVEEPLQIIPDLMNTSTNILNEIQQPQPTNLDITDVLLDSLKLTSSIGYLANRINVADVLAASMAITTKIKYTAFVETPINQLVSTAIDTSNQLEERKGVYIKVGLDRKLSLIDDFNQSMLVGYVDISDKFGEGVIPKTYHKTNETEFIQELKTKLNGLDEWKTENQWIVEIVPPAKTDTIDGHELKKIWIYNPADSNAYKIDESDYQFEFLDPNKSLNENAKEKRKLSLKYSSNTTTPCPNERTGTQNLTKEQCAEKIIKINNEYDKINEMQPSQP